MSVKYTDLQNLLPAFAKLGNGLAVLCDENGVVIDSSEHCDDANTKKGLFNSYARQCIATGDLIYSTETEGITTNTLKLGENWLVIDNRYQAGNSQTYKDILYQALPYIAQIAGGDAVLFDRQGTRLHAVHPDGSPNPEAIGVINRSCKRVMDEMRPSIGLSALGPWATAVRIPLAKEYGLAFNNKLMVKRQQRLLDAAHRFSYARYQMEDIIGDSQAIALAKELARSAAKTHSTILLTGETGTGKEIFAQAIHNASARLEKPFIAINCGAISANLVESTLFGYVDGAFTGAKKAGQVGAFEQADGGTLFLDEISEMSLELQVKLLRVLQELEVVRVGDTKARKIDVRIIASTNKPLFNLVKNGRFRSDLYFRLNVLEIAIPPLRDRGSDILALIDHFVKKFSLMMGKHIQDINPDVLKTLTTYHWPGNVRELQNCFEHIFNVIDINAGSISLENLPRNLRDAKGTKDDHISLYEEYMQKVERDFVLRALELSNYNKTVAAKRLGMDRTTLWRIVKRYRLDELRQDEGK